jgi:hypothetical protein
MKNALNTPPIPSGERPKSFAMKGIAVAMAIRSI